MIARSEQNMDSCSSSEVNLMKRGEVPALSNHSPSRLTCDPCVFRETCRDTQFQRSGVDHAISRHSWQIPPKKSGVTGCSVLSEIWQVVRNISIKISGGSR